VLDSGRHNGQQVIPLEWWHEMLTVSTPNADGDAAFGYLWWIIPDKGWYCMRGHGGQFVLLKPSKHLMIVGTSFTQTEDDFSFTFEMMTSLADKVDAASR